MRANEKGCVNRRRPGPSVHPRKLPGCSFCSTHKRKRPSEWGHAVGFPLWTVLGVLGICKPPLWPVLDLSDGASWGLWGSSLGCHGHLQTLPGTFTVWIYLWNTFGSLASFDVCLYFWALPQELGKLAEAGSLQALPVGASFGWNHPLGIRFLGIHIGSQVVRCRIILVLLLGDFDEKQEPRAQMQHTENKDSVVSSMGTLNSHRCNDWSECSELCFLLQFTVPTLSVWNNAMILFIYFSSHWTQYCFLISCAFLCDLFEVIFPMLQLFYSLF